MLFRVKAVERTAPRQGARFIFIRPDTKEKVVQGNIRHFAAFAGLK